MRPPPHHILTPAGSLLPPLAPLRYPQVKWLPDVHERAPAFLLQVPCSWGALFLGSHWRDFLAFYRQRAAPPFFNFSQARLPPSVGGD